MSVTPAEVDARASRAIAIMAAAARRPTEEWRVVAVLELLEGAPANTAGIPRGEWLDFACPATGLWGQCFLREDGTWAQPPRGTAPVILEWRRPGGPR